MSSTRNALITGSSFSSLVLNRIVLRNLDLKGKKFEGCAFLGVVWENVTCDQSEFRNCFLDFSSFHGFSALGVTMIFCSVSGSFMRECSWNRSDLLHVNFNGIDAENCDFSESDLYFSRFNAGLLRQVEFRDCNLKKTQFVGSKRERVSFQYSNDEESEMEEEGTSI